MYHKMMKSCCLNFLEYSLYSFSLDIERKHSNTIDRDIVVIYSCCCKLLWDSYNTIIHDPWGAKDRDSRCQLDLEINQQFTMGGGNSYSKKPLFIYRSFT